MVVQHVALRAGGAFLLPLLLLVVSLPASSVDMIVAASGGERHTCAVSSAGGVQCWGFNTYGQVGDASTTERHLPVAVSGLASGIKAVSAGSNHTCALTTAGGVKCWGRNLHGELGNGSFVLSSVPVDVTGLASGILAIAAGANHNCALTTAGGVKCWGYGGAGQMGNGSVANQSSPVDVPGLTSGVAAITSGRYHTCALTIAGAVKCWGWNFYGQIGDGTTTQRDSPVDVTGLSGGIAAIEAGYDHTCVLTNGRGIKCWGYNGVGQLGTGSSSIIPVTAPVAVQGLVRGIARIAAGQLHTCALTTGGGLKCWGYGANGSLGTGNSSQQNSPVDVPGYGSGVAHATCGGSHCLAIMTGGGWKAWGLDFNGQLGDNATTTQFSPIDIAALSGGTGAAFAVVLEGAQETPSVGSPAVGTGYAVVDTAANTVSLDLGFFGLSSGVTAAHLHGPAARGVAAGVKVPIDTASPIVQTVSYAEPDEADILAGQWYANVHTTNFAGGEIRGQLDTLGEAPAFLAGVDFDANARADLPWQHTDGRAAIWLMEGLAPVSAAEIIGAGTGWSVTHFADFDGDRRSDLLWEHTDGRSAIYLMDGTVPAATQGIRGAGTGWSTIHARDLDGDGMADLVEQNADGRVAVRLVTGTAAAANAEILGPGTGWSVTHTGDFDADRKGDLLWTHADGRVAIWRMDGASLAGSNQILNAGSGWSVAHVADFDGDAKSDICWQHTDGSVALWLMDGGVMSAGAGVLGAGTGWLVAKTGDFDGDGKADLYFEHGDGRAAIYLMNGLVPAATAQILNAGGGWSAKRIQDLDGDRKSDIVWENADGSAAIWLMNGTAMSSGAGILGPASGWSVSGASP